MSEVERKWQEAYQQHVHRISVQNEQIRASNAWVEQAARTLAQNPTFKTARALARECPDYGLRQVLDKQVKAGESYQYQVKWRAEQHQVLSRQAGSWLGLSQEAREAKAKLSYLNDPQGSSSSLEHQMREKHYTFWIHARQETKAKPVFGFAPGAYQREEHAVVSLSSFAQQREAVQRQEQAEQLRLKQYQHRGPKLGGRGLG